MVRRLLALASIIGGISVVPLALGATADTNARVQIAGSGTTYTATLANTGSEPILCWQITLPTGVQSTGFQTPPTGWQVGGATAPPAQTIGGQNRTAGIPPGGSASFTFTTSGPLGNGSQARVSSTCTSGSDVTVSASGPGSSSPPPPAPKPCVCKNLTARINDNARVYVAFVAFTLVWELTCSDGAGTCSGTLTPRPPRADRADGHRILPAKSEDPLAAECRGRCARKTRDVEYYNYAAVGKPLTAARRARERVVTIVIERTCGARQLAPLLLDIAFNDKGRVDRSRSDYNGNGVPDGKE